MHILFPTLLATADFSIPAAKVFYINAITSTDRFSYLSRPHFKATSWHPVNRVNNWISANNTKAELSRGSNSDNPPDRPKVKTIPHRKRQSSRSQW